MKELERCSADRAQSPSRHLYKKLCVSMLSTVRGGDGFLELAVYQPRVRFHKRALSKRDKEDSGGEGCPTSSHEPEHIHIATHTCQNNG